MTEPGPGAVGQPGPGFVGRSGPDVTEPGPGAVGRSGPGSAGQPASDVPGQPGPGAVGQPPSGTTEHEQFLACVAALDARGPGRMVPELGRITRLLDRMGQPERAYPAIHLTGTNGKTSTARMIDALLRAFGLRVGRYTSPHLSSVTERISLDGSPISERGFIEAYQDVAAVAQLTDAEERTNGGDPLTYFEFCTAMAFAAFADAPVDVAVVEVGLGGRWDATNVLDAGVAVITPISLDHTGLLGATTQAIATEKAGIIAREATVITALQDEDATEVVMRTAAERAATVAREGLEFGVVERLPAVGGQQLRLQGLGGVYDDVFLPLMGAHQAGNAGLALAAVEAFLGGGKQGRINPDTVIEGFRDSSSPGRLERVRSSPTVMLDAAHNPAGMAATVATLSEDFSFSRLVVVLAVLSDKDAAGMLGELQPIADAVVITRNASERSADIDALAAEAVEIFDADRVQVEPRLDDAIAAAITLVEEDAQHGMSGLGVLITGSVVTVAEARELLRQ